MAELITPGDWVRAYVYAGDWVGDCPRSCGNVELLVDPRTGKDRTIYRCSYCHLVVEKIDWPSNRGDIMSVLNLRPVPHNRNWYPLDHETALKFRLPHGQSVEDLKEENREHGVPAEVN